MPALKIVISVLNNKAVLGSRHFVYQPNCNSFKKDEKQIEQIYNLFQSLQDGLESQTKNLDESYCGFYCPQGVRYFAIGMGHLMVVACSGIKDHTEAILPRNMCDIIQHHKHILGNY